MNKKILSFFILLIVSVLVFPQISGAVSAQVTAMADNIKEVMIAIGAAIVVIGWVVAGIIYLTSMGKPDKMQTGQKAIVAAVIGTALVIIAEAGYGLVSGIVDNIISAGK